MAESWQLPDLANVDNRWYDPTGRQISIEDAYRYLPPRYEPTVALTVDFKDRSAGVLTMFMPFDLLPQRGKTAKPHVYVTFERYRIRRIFRRPKLHQNYVSFSQSKTAALAAHDQAVKHVQYKVGYNRVWWRRIYVSRRVVFVVLFLGFIQWVVNMAYLIHFLATHG